MPNNNYMFHSKKEKKLRKSGYFRLIVQFTCLNLCVCVCVCACCFVDQRCCLLYFPLPGKMEVTAGRNYKAGIHHLSATCFATLLLPARRLLGVRQLVCLQLLLFQLLLCFVCNDYRLCVYYTYLCLYVCGLLILETARLLPQIEKGFNHPVSKATPQHALLRRISSAKATCW